MTAFVFDVEADGPYPGDYSMVSIGIIRLQADLTTAPTFFGQTAPISNKFKPEALAAIRVTREEHLTYEAPEIVMPRLLTYFREHCKGRPHMISDNPAFDWQFLNMYLHRYTGDNPCGWSARRVGDFYAGLKKNFHETGRNWRRHVQTPHDHNPINDARGVAEALLAMQAEYGLHLV